MASESAEPTIESGDDHSSPQIIAASSRNVNLSSNPLPSSFNRLRHKLKLIQLVPSMPIEMTPLKKSSGLTTTSR
ncbi:hypothetical protein DIRU0_D29118 [Diutina rugosa]